MTLLAYVDARPYLFIVGLPVFVGLALLVSRAVNTRLSKVTVVFSSSFLFAVLFTVFLTGVGPFIDQHETREFVMNWRIEPSSSNGMKEAKVVLTFTKYPGHFIGESSDELAAHIRKQGGPTVRVIFGVTSDYGTVRSFNAIEIAGLRGWKSEWSHAGTTGASSDSPWDVDVQ